MKATRLLFIGGLVMAACLAAAPAAFAVISGSAHDFTGEAWNSSGRLCVVCHTPHNADTAVTGSPLWNHEVSTAVYSIYFGSGTLDAAPNMPFGVSKLCLSCHDGTVAVDSFSGATGADFITGDAKIGTNLTNDHPIAITYDAALAAADGELYDPTTQSSGLGGTIANDMLLGPSHDQLHCTSCHDVHNSAGNAKLLQVDNTGSALCLTCHNK